MILWWTTSPHITSEVWRADIFNLSFSSQIWEVLSEEIRRSIACFRLMLLKRTWSSLSFYFLLSKYHTECWPAWACFCDILGWFIAKTWRWSCSLQPLHPGWRSQPLGHWPQPSTLYRQCLLSSQNDIYTCWTVSVKERNPLINMRKLRPQPNSHSNRMAKPESLNL